MLCPRGVLVGDECSVNDVVALVRLKYVSTRRMTVHVGWVNREHDGCVWEGWT